MSPTVRLRDRHVILTGCDTEQLTTAPEELKEESDYGVILGAFSETRTILESSYYWRD